VTGEVWEVKAVSLSRKICGGSLTLFDGGG